MCFLPQLLSPRAPWRTPDPSPFRIRSGFSLIELVLVMAMLMLLTGLTLAGLGSGRDSTDLSRAAYTLAARAESAATATRADRVERFLVIAGEDIVPRDQAGRAYQVVEDRTDPDVQWDLLPRGMVFANLAGVERLPGFPPGLLAVLKTTPDGEFRCGVGEEPVGLELEIDWGEVLNDPGIDPGGRFRENKDVPPWRARLVFRPRTGVVRVEEVVEPEEVDE